MNIAIEYVIRKGLTSNNLQIPFSLFLYNIKNIEEIVVLTFQNYYGNKNNCIVKRWNLNDLKKSDIIPNRKEFLVEKKDLTTSPFVILEDFNVFKYVEEPYKSPPKQYSDEPHSTIQKTNFDKTFNRFLNCEKNILHKKNILWSFFSKTFFKSSVQKTQFGSIPNESQKELVKNICPIPWKVWNIWLKYIWLNNEKLKYSPELIFEKYYNQKLEKNEFYLEMEKKKMLSPFTITTDFF